MVSFLCNMKSCTSKKTQQPGLPTKRPKVFFVKYIKRMQP